MKKLVLVTAVAATLAAPAAVFAQAAPAAAPASPHTFTANVGVVSDYLFRGISQTRGKPALQGGADYSHSSGLYAGIWGSTIKWVSDAQNTNVPLEVDVYGGYKNAFAGGDWNYDLGLITYNYPGTKDVPLNASAKANTSEVYGAIGWKWLTAKYSYATSKNFIAWYGGPGGVNSGVVGPNGTLAPRIDTRGSDYLELNAVYDLGEGWGVTGHIGKQKVKNYTKVSDTNASYADYKVGVTKDTPYGVFGLAVSATTSKGACPSNGVAPANGLNAYCWGVYNAGTTSSNNFRNMSQSQAVLSYSKSF
jgi:uncharacterized protein (TIGR02001 family)